MSKPRQQPLPAEVEEALQLLTKRQILALDRLVRMDAGPEADPTKQLDLYTQGLERTLEFVRAELGRKHAEREALKQSVHPITAASLERIGE
jgi:hypothetical protein